MIVVPTRGTRVASWQADVMAGGAFSDDHRPVAADRVQTAVFDGEAVVYDEATSVVHRLAAVAAATWVCCDGRTTVEAITDVLADSFGTTSTEIRPQVHAALRSLREAGLLVGADPVDDEHPV